MGNKIKLVCIFVVVFAILSTQVNALNRKVAFNAWEVISRFELAYGIPRGLLHSMSLVETGGGMGGHILPWPYTVGVNGTGASFKSRTKAIAELNNLQNLTFKRFNIAVGETTKHNLTYSKALQLLKSARGNIFKVSGKHYSRQFNNRGEATVFAKGIIAKGYNNLDIGLMQINWKYHSSGFRDVGEAFKPHKNINYAVSYLKKHRKTRDWWRSVGRYHSGTKKYATRYIDNVWAMYQRIHRMDKNV